MGSETPVVYLFHGEDQLGMGEDIDRLKSRLGDDATVELNTSNLDERTFSLAELETVATTIPFLAPRRLILLHNTLSRLQNNQDREQFLKILSRIPPQTALLILEMKPLARGHWLMQWVETARDRAFVKFFPLPQGRQMVSWIRDRAKQEGGEFAPQAADYLASLTGNNTRLAAHEIDKMLAFVGYRRAVETDDVQHLFAPIDQEEVSQIFQMVDALGERRGPAAIRLLQGLLQVREAMSLFGMIVRQFRLLLLAREILEAGGDASVVRDQLGLADFVARKVINQARNFDIQTGEEIYRALLALDMQIKSGQIDAEVALDTLTAQITSHSMSPSH